ncbi:MAG: hypothetical protein ACXWUR_00260 [Allosphingosinicella sp.]
MAPRLEPRWIDLFVEMIGLASPRAGEVAAICSESGSRRLLVALVEHALHRLGLAYYHVMVPTPAPPPGHPSGPPARRWRWAVSRRSSMRSPAPT